MTSVPEQTAAQSGIDRGLEKLWLALAETDKVRGLGDQICAGRRSPISARPTHLSPTRIASAFSSFNLHLLPSFLTSGSASDTPCHGSDGAVHVHVRPVARLLLHGQARLVVRQRRPLRIDVVVHRHPARGRLLLLVSLRRSGSTAHHIRSANREARVFVGREGRQSCHGMHQAVEVAKVDCASVGLPCPPGDADGEECVEEEASQGPQDPGAQVKP